MSAGVHGLVLVGLCALLQLLDLCSTQNSAQRLEEFCWLSPLLGFFWVSGVDGDLLEVSGEENARSAAYKSANERKQYDPEQLEEYFKDRHIECWRRRLQVATPLLVFATNVRFVFQGSRKGILLA